MSDQSAQSTSAELAEVRAEAEGDFLASVTELESRAKRLTEAVEIAAVSAATQETPAADFELPGLPRAESPTTGSPRLPDQAPWPKGAGIRGLLNRFTAWLLRDYLVVLDARHEALAARSLDLEHDAAGVAAKLHGALVDGVAHAHRCVEALSDHVAAQRTAAATNKQRLEDVREAVTRCAEAVDLLSEVALKQRAMANAKDAESAHRAFHAPDLKIEVALDRLARRQESLLAGLLDKRE
ncbi:MAG: hypothetical protein GKS06_06450 [Acidobacteria bacterium]|nr:hypothetical protein [Acidobacteriota bacterium]